MPETCATQGTCAIRVQRSPRGGLWMDFEKLAGIVASGYPCPIKLEGPVAALSVGTVAIRHGCEIYVAGGSIRLKRTQRQAMEAASSLEAALFLSPRRTRARTFALTIRFAFLLSA